MLLIGLKMSCWMHFEKLRNPDKRNVWTLSVFLLQPGLLYPVILWTFTHVNAELWLKIKYFNLRLLATISEQNLSIPSCIPTWAKPTFSICFKSTDTQQFICLKFECISGCYQTLKQQIVKKKSQLFVNFDLYFNHK